MQDVFFPLVILDPEEEMSEQQILAKITQLEKTVDAADNRTRRLGDKFESLKDYIQKDLALKVATADGRSVVLMWFVGIALSVYMALIIGGGVQLYLLNGRLSAMERDVSHVAKGVDELKLKSTSANPTDPQNIKQAHDTLAEAASSHRKLNKEVVVEAGRKFVDAGGSVESAWQTAMEFLAYRSFLNVDLVANSAELNRGANDVTVYHIPKGAGELYHTGTVPIENAAVFQKLGEDTNKGRTTGDARLLVDGGTVVLDSFDIRHVIFRNAHIVYNGDPVRLQDVAFANCTFEVVQKYRGQEFAKAVLTPEPTIQFGAV